MESMKIFLLAAIILVLAGCSQPKEPVNPAPAEKSINDQAFTFSIESYKAYATGDCEKFYPLLSQQILLFGQNRTINKSKEVKLNLCYQMDSLGEKLKDGLLVAQILVLNSTEAKRLGKDIGEGKYIALLSEQGRNAKMVIGVEKGKRGWEVFATEGFNLTSPISIR